MAAITARAQPEGRTLRVADPLWVDGEAMGLTKDQSQ